MEISKHLARATVTYRFRSAILGLVGIAIAAIPFFQVANFEFLNYDDPLHITQQEIVLTGINAESMAWGLTATPSNLWHPLTWWSYMVEVSLFNGGTNAGVHHLGNLTIYLLTCMVFYQLLRKFSFGRLAAITASLVFAYHPMHAEPVAWISARKELLFTCLSLGAILLYTHRRKREQTTPWVTIALWVTFLAALLAKPTAVIIPALFVIVDVAIPKSGQPESWPSVRTFFISLKRNSSFFAVAAVAAIIAVWVQSTGSLQDSLSSSSLIDRLAYLPAKLGFYAKLVVFPLNPAFEYAYPVGSTKLLLSISGILLLAGSAWLALSPRSPRVLGLAAGWFIVCLIPVLGFVYVGNSFASDRYLCLALTGPCIALAFVIDKLNKRSQIIAAPLLGLILIGLAYESSRATSFWRNDLTLFTESIRDIPQSITAHTNLAGYYDLQGDSDKALVHYQAAVEIDPLDAIANYNVGRLQYRAGNTSEAIQKITTAIKEKPNFTAAKYLLASIYSKEDLPTQLKNQAGPLFAAACADAPGNLRYQFAYARHAYENRELKLAKELCVDAINNPNNPEEWRARFNQLLIAIRREQETSGSQRSREPGHPRAAQQSENQDTAGDARTRTRTRTPIIWEREPGHP